MACLLSLSFSSSLLLSLHAFVGGWGAILSSSSLCLDVFQHVKGLVHVQHQAHVQVIVAHAEDRGYYHHSAVLALPPGVVRPLVVLDVHGFIVAHVRMPS